MPNQRLFINNGRETELFVVNNAGLFGLYSDLLLGFLAKANVILAYPGFWLDKAHSNHNGDLWGHSPINLPPMAQLLFFEIFPKHNPFERMTWLHFKALRTHLLQRIIAFENVIFFQGDLSVSRTDSTTEIAFQNNENDTLSIRGPITFHYWLRKAKENKLQLGPSTPAYQLYQLAPNQYPNPVCILGAGLTTAWIVRDFNVTVISLYLPDDPQIIIPANAGINMSLLHRLLIVPDRISLVANHTINYRPTKDPMLPNQVICPLYDAIGFEPTGAPKSILNLQQGWSIKTAKECHWISPKTSPRGSLLYSYTHLAHESHHFPAWFGNHPGQYCENYFIDAFTAQLHDLGVAVPKHFFEQLKSEIQGLEDTVEEKTLLNIYSKIYNVTSDRPDQFTVFMNFIAQSPKVFFSPSKAVRGQFPPLLEMDPSKTNPGLLSQLIQDARGYFETHLAYSLGQNRQVFLSTQKVAHAVHQLMTTNRDLILAMIKENPMFQLTVYSDEKFARFYPAINQCLPAEFLFELFQRVLGEGQDLFALMHLICMFGFRIYPSLPLDSKRSIFEKKLNLFESNTTFRNENSRLQSITPELKKTFFGLVPTELPDVSAHTTSLGKYHTNDLAYAALLQRFGMAFITGYSGHTSRLLSLAFTFTSLTLEEQKAFTAGAFAYLAGGGNHHFHEIYAVARLFGLPLVDGAYTEALPKDYIESQAYIQVQNKIKTKLLEIAAQNPAHAAALSCAGFYYFGFQPSDGNHTCVESAQMGSSPPPSMVSREDLLRSSPQLSSAGILLLKSGTKHFCCSASERFVSHSLILHGVNPDYASIASSLSYCMALYCLYGKNEVFMHLFLKLLSNNNYISPEIAKRVSLLLTIILTLYTEELSSTTVWIFISQLIIASIGSKAGTSFGGLLANGLFGGNGRLLEGWQGGALFPRVTQ